MACRDRFAAALAIVLAACHSAEPERVDDLAPMPSGSSCAPQAESPCLEQPAVALAMPAMAGAMHSLVVGTQDGALHRVLPDGDGIGTAELGFVRGDAFHALDRLLPCDPEGDQDAGLVYTNIDSLDPGYYVFGITSPRDVFGKRTPDRRHQAARCIDIDADGRDDLVGLVAQDELGVVRGQAWGLPDGIETWRVPSVATEDGDPDYVWQVVTSAAADLDDDGAIEWMWVVRGRDVVRSWSLQSDRQEVVELPAVEVAFAVDRIDLADLDGDGIVDLVSTGTRGDGEGIVAVSTGDGAGGFGPPRDIIFAEPLRRISFADIDDDGDDEIVATGAWIEGVVVIDDDDDSLEIIAAFPALANDAVALRFDANASWDLVILHADTWNVELRRDAFAAVRE